MKARSTRGSTAKPAAPVIKAALAAEKAKPNGNEANGTETNGHGSGELHELLRALQAMRVGDFSVRMSGDHVGLVGKIADTFNEVVTANQRMAKELERVGEVVGRQGKTRQRVKLGVPAGSWGKSVV